MKILLLEDEKMLQASIKEYIETLGHQCIAFSDGKEAALDIIEQFYDLLILDINVPSLTGLELLQDIKLKNCNTPTIFISALVDIETITEAFDLGAADYIKKPFHLKELALRVQKVANDLDHTKKQHIMLTKNYSYVKKENKLLYDGKEQILTNKQSKILQSLCQHIGTIISFDIFREYAWESDYVSDATIRAEISRFRKVLKEDFIQNHKGVGYKVDRYIISPS